MSTTIITRAVVATVVVGALGLGAAQQVRAQVTPVPVGGPLVGVTAVGEATVRTAPDVARVTLGVELVDASSEAVEREAGRRMEAVAQRLHAAGVPDARQRTVAYALAPQQDWQDGRPGPIRSYQLVHLIEADVGPGQVGALVDAATTAGANRVGVTFDTRDPKAIEAQAREQAVADARRRAEGLARAGGAALGRLAFVEELAVERPTRPMPTAQGDPSTLARITAGEQQLRLVVRAGWSLAE